MITPADYVLNLKTRLTTSPSVDTFTVVVEKIWPERGYIRVRVTLDQGDFLELAEYFVVEKGEHKTCRYRYQWMDKDCKTLRKRWDNVEHYPDLPNFPHHIQVASEGNVVSGECMSIAELLDRVLE